MSMRKGLHKRKITSLVVTTILGGYTNVPRYCKNEGIRMYEMTTCWNKNAVSALLSPYILHSKL